MLLYMESTVDRYPHIINVMWSLLYIIILILLYIESTVHNTTHIIIYGVQYIV